MIHTLDKTYKSPQSIFVGLIDGQVTVIPIENDINLLYEKYIKGVLE